MQAIYNHNDILKRRTFEAGCDVKYESYLVIIASIKKYDDIRIELTHHELRDGYSTILLRVCIQ